MKTFINKVLSYTQKNIIIFHVKLNRVIIVLKFISTSEPMVEIPVGFERKKNFNLKWYEQNERTKRHNFF